MIKMKYFDSDWISGNLSDDEYNKREKKYNLQLEKLKKTMAITERIFADINFNDAKIVSFRQNRKILSVKFFIGDLQNGYYELKVEFFVQKANLLDKGEIIASEIQKIDNKFYFVFIFTNLQEYKIEFIGIKNLEFNRISEKEYFKK